MKKIFKTLSVMLSLVLLLGLCPLGIVANATETENHFINAEDFASTGVWAIMSKAGLAGADAVFGDYILSGQQTMTQGTYAPATKEITIKNGGTYRVWVRAMIHSNTGGTETSWRFKVSVDSDQLAATFGGNGASVQTYAWQDGGTVTLEAGTHTFSVLDPYANYAKFNAIYITNDTEVIPEDDYDTFMQRIGDTEEEAPAQSYFIHPTGFDPLGTWTLTDDNLAYNGKTLGGMQTIIAGQGTDATATLEDVPAGTYRIWIHGRELPNTPQQAHSWQFKAKVNGNELPVIFGGGGKNMAAISYVWEDGGTVELVEGTNTISLVDPWCDYAKCDAVFITSDIELDPSSKAMALLESSSIVIKDVVEIDNMENFNITDEYAGGNIVVVSKLNNTISLDNKVDPEEGSTPYFYWNFEATSDADRTVTFVFNQNKNYTTPLIGTNYKLLYSKDDGKTWSYMPSINTTSFKYTFTAGETVRFSNVLPYVLDDYNEFVEANKDNERAEFTTLREKAIELGLSTDTVTFKSKEGRELPLIVIGNQNAKKCLVFTSRHHSCETIGSYTLEGMIQYYLDDVSDAFLNEYCVYVVPIVDIDGVENGEQGKGRGGLDHNRDYGIGTHVEVTAITTFFTEVFKNQKVVVFLDSHAPGSVTTDLGNHLSYGSTDSNNPYGTQDMEIALQPQVLLFSDILDELENADTNEDKLTYNPNNAWRAYGQDGMARVWFARCAENYNIVATTLETSFTATPNDHNPDNTIRWGKQIGEAAAKYLDLYDEDAEPEIYEVVFKDNLGNVLSSVEVSEGGFVDADAVPAVPSRYGYSFIDWSYDINLPIMSDMVITALYEKNSELLYSVIIPDYAEINMPEGQTGCHYNDRVTVIAPAVKDGKKFSYWKANGCIFSYSDDISFLAFGDVEMEAVYGEDRGDRTVIFTDSNPTVTDKGDGKYDMHVMGVVVAPGGKVTEVGIILAAGEYTAEEMTNGTATTVKLVADKATSGRQFVYTIKNIGCDKIRTAVVYAVIDGKMCYSDVSCTAVVESKPDSEYGGDEIVDTEKPDPFD